MVTAMQSEKKKKRFLYSVARVVCPPLFKLLYRYIITNGNSLPKTGPCIICSNHLSYADPILVGIGQPREIRFMAKSELFKNKFFAWLITSMGAFPVQRGNAADTGFDSAESIIKNGEILGIFPEGTRSKTGELLRIRSGAAMLAAQLQVPVLPMCITPKGGKIKFFNPTKITYGKLLSPEELGVTGEKPNLRNASRIISKAIEDIRERDKF